MALLKRAEQSKLDTPMPAPPTWRVWAVTPQVREVNQTARFLARLDPRNTASLASKLNGQISRLAVEESQAVKAGDLLAQIDDNELRSSIDGLRASLDAARSQRDYNFKQLQRNRELFKAHTIARDRLDASEAAYNSAAAQVRELEQRILGLENQLHYTRITAPFDAVVGSIFLREGDLAVPGKPILSLNSLPQKLTFGFMPGVADIRAGQPVLFNGRRIGRLRKLYSDARDGLWVAEVALEERVDQPAGSYLSIDVVTRSGKGCAVPVRALINRDEQYSVMRHDGERFAEQPVELIAMDDRYALIEPCMDAPVAVAAESKLVLLPAAGSRVSLYGERDD